MTGIHAGSLVDGLTPQPLLPGKQTTPYQWKVNYHICLKVILSAHICSHSHLCILFFLFILFIQPPHGGEDLHTTLILHTQYIHVQIH